MRYAVVMLVLISCTLPKTGLSETATVKTVVWRERPVALSMVPNEEKILSFDEDVQWSIPRSLLGIIDGEAVSGNVLLTAMSEFASTRFHFRGIDSGRYYILDLFASSRGEQSAVRIKLPGPSASTPQAEAQRRPSSMIELTRFAFQSLYAPERLIEQPHDVQVIRLKRKLTVSNLVPGAAVFVTPIRQWRSSGGLYATALELRNAEPHSIELDAKRLRYSKHWITLSTLTGALRPSQTPGDSTIVVVLSDSAWSEASKWLH